MTANHELTYQKPPEEILEWADAVLPPVARINSQGSHIVFLDRQRYLAIEELYEPELRLAGIRIHPDKLVRSRSSYYTGIRIQEIEGNNLLDINGLPASLRIHHIQWSPDEKKLALSCLIKKSLKLWVIDIQTRTAYQVSEVTLNALLTTPFSWHPDSQSLFVLGKTPDADHLISKENVVPHGPVISDGHENPAQHRTYQDLLNDSTDVINFTRLVQSQLSRVTLDGKNTMITRALIKGIKVSPNGRFVLLTEVRQPFSNHVPYDKFPYQVTVFDLLTNEHKELEKTPLQDQLPKGFMAVHQKKRLFQWRNDQPAVLIFCQALDEGDPAKDVSHRDAIYQWTAPFDKKPQEILKTVNRFSHIQWSQSGFGIAVDYWYNTRNSKTYLVQPDQPEVQSKILFDRDLQDNYGDPGHFVTVKNKWGRSVVGGDKYDTFLSGEGIRPDGIHPFLDQYNVQTGQKTRVWEAKNKDELLRIAGVQSIAKKTLIVRRETTTEFPNYFRIHWDRPDERQYLTDFDNPFTGINSIRKSIISYQRSDGTELHATLYLPASSTSIDNMSEYPLLMWAYPEEYTNKKLAGQMTTSEHEFTYPWYGSPVFWARRGYAVLDDVSFPIISSGDQNMNDTFIEQLRDNASAAIDAVCKNHPIDSKRVAVGGHSYGAFMTANLLTWTNLFCAGIARSGAYNRTLTPFGFQGEQRTYWEAPALYQKMSPFMHADKMKTPLLLIHGQMDNNSGTHTMQSQRYFDALKSLGAPIRLVLLPNESHHYRSRDSVLHMLWEQDQWLQKHLKPSTI
ncbi:prolyl oligopeptidase family serine peptidase [Membranicola marinus]|uniref:Prolyl oligopeptidase family serine peptidase n=1 Tax=Membranihabitans marinus TaxID=1227546 RepID=A0A953HNJ2_9BACT|nr:prolyl oligopeptidase family serine peptidase [Membranihabitans marinus]MBY5958882.1 prolyl oligopeptidase family serine peptidase [Membranihabitans marinus]